MLLTLLLLAQAAQDPAREVRLVFGTTAEVRTAGLEDSRPAIDAAFAALSRVEQCASLWSESELTRLNRLRTAVVSSDLFAILTKGIDVARDSRGAFDPTIEPLIRASGGYGGKARGLGCARRRRLLFRVGFDRIHLEAPGQRVRLDKGTTLDLNAIAKGYAVDEALAALRAAGARSGLVDAGGSSLGVFGEPIEVALRNPEGAGAPPLGSFELRDASVGSSGGDQHPGHILDPRTGRPPEAAVAVTVVARTAAEADALSTAVYVLGQAGLDLLQRRRAKGLVLLREGGRLMLWTTAGFAADHGLRVAPGIDVREHGQP